ncbi:uncharacterized protein LOC144645599 [Oculina patagonica]
MYSIYVTSKLDFFVYMRLSVEKMPTADSYAQKIKKEIVEGNLHPLANQSLFVLALGGFCLITPGKTHAFLVENVAAPVYVSVVYRSTVWVANFPLDPKMYGCIAIRSVFYQLGDLEDDENIVVSPYNPEAVWLPAKTRDKLPSDIIKAGVGRSDNEHLYFGRKASMYGGIPCAVTSNGSLCNMWSMAGSVTFESGELLKNTAFELIRAKRGDPIPPNAVMTGVTEADGSLYVGRVGGSIPCHITTEDGKIQCFVYGFNKEIRVANGEVMVLTR